VNDASATRDARAMRGREGKGREGNIHVESTREARVTDASDAELMAGFALITTHYPKRPTAPTILDEREYQQRIADGIPHAELEAGARRYAAFVASGGVSGPLYVMQMAKFFALPNRFWCQSWDTPMTLAQAKRAEAEKRDLAELRERAGRVGYRDFIDGTDDLAGYRTLVERAETADRDKRVGAGGPQSVAKLLGGS
jgi:hypothetical protein